MSERTESVLLEQVESVAVLTLNRPAVLNAFDAPMADLFLSRVKAVAEWDGIRAILLRGAGKGFCAGGDVSQFLAGADIAATIAAIMDPLHEALRILDGLPQPTVACLHGAVAGGGFSLALGCDLAVAADSARLAVSGINVGLFCATPAVALTRNVPLKNAFEMLVTGQFIGARQAAERGLVNHAVPDAELDRAVQGLVDAILAKSPVAVRIGKAMVYRQLGLPLDQAYDYAAGVMAENMLAEDVGEGIDAFMQKRPPQWRGC